MAQKIGYFVGIIGILMVGVKLGLYWGMVGVCVWGGIYLMLPSE